MNGLPCNHILQWCSYRLASQSCGRSKILPFLDTFKQWMSIFADTVFHPICGSGKSPVSSSFTSPSHRPRHSTNVRFWPFLENLTQELHAQADTEQRFFTFLTRSIRSALCKVFHRFTGGATPGRNSLSAERTTRIFGNHHIVAETFNGKFTEETLAQPVSIMTTFCCVTVFPP